MTSSGGGAPQGSLPCSRLSLECCTQTTGTSAERAFSTTVPMFATTLSRSYASLTTPFCTSITSRSVFGRFWNVVMASPWLSNAGSSRVRRRRALALVPPCQRLPHRCLQLDLPEPDLLRRDLDCLVRPDDLERQLDGQRPRRN